MTALPRHICLISGGKDSTALAIYLQQKRPEINIEYVFCDTRKELDEIYEYLTRLEAFLGKPIVRLEGDFGERGFDHYLDMFRGYLPSPSMRWCTRKLKIEPFERYVGEEEAFLYVGIRGDEEREGYISTKPNLVPVFPFKEDGVVKADVMRILENSGVGLPKYYEWRTRSGCYFCFFQRKIEWVGLMEQHPQLFEEAKKYEKVDEGYTWVQGESLDELAARSDDIKRAEMKRKAQLASRQQPRTLGEVYTGELADPDEEVGCLICHL